MQKIPRKHIQKYIDEYKELISRMEEGPKKQLLQDNEWVIIAAFNEYDTNINQLEIFSSSCITDQDLKNILVAKFETSDAFKSKIREDFYSRKCPYCGFRSLEENIPVEHFLPKSKFQEYSLLGLNLFLCCQSCNSKKWSGWITSTRDTLNPYIDDLYDRQFLSIKISSWKRKSVTVEMNDSCCISLQEKWLLRRHFEKFDLTKRISNFINTDIAKLIDTIYRNQQTRPHFEINKYLEEMYFDHKFSDWTSAILTVVFKYFIDNPDILNELLEYHKSTKT